MNLALTPDQSRALASVPSDPIRVTDPATNAEYVLLKAEVFERWQRAVSEDAYASAEMLDRLMADDDAADPYLAELQSKYREYTK